MVRDDDALKVSYFITLSWSVTKHVHVGSAVRVVFLSVVGRELVLVLQERVLRTLGAARSI